MKFLFIFLTFLLIISNVNALRCYTCGYITSTIEKTCLENPENDKITDCDKKYCTIIRQELLKPAGFIQSFLRGCEDQYINDVFEDSTFKTYYRACSNELCNTGNGIGLVGPGFNPDGEEHENLLVQGLPGSSSINKINWILFCIVGMILKIVH